MKYKSKDIAEKVKRVKNGDSEALDEIIIQMTPLIIKYARKIHFLEFEDAKQELYIILIKCIPYIEDKKTAQEILAYMSTSVRNAYRQLCKKHFQSDYFKFISIDNTSDSDSNILLSSDSFLNDLVFDIDFKAYIQEQYSKNQLKGQILYLIFFNGMTDKEIAASLKVTRQYINRVKKQMLIHFFKT